MTRGTGDVADEVAQAAASTPNRMTMPVAISAAET
jgi:hypothetical protein